MNILEIMELNKEYRARIKSKKKGQYDKEDMHMVIRTARLIKLWKHKGSEADKLSRNAITNRFEEEKKILEEILGR